MTLNDDLKVADYPEIKVMKLKMLNLFEIH